jgi:rhodanese-related sulfurtransferase
MSTTIKHLSVKQAHEQQSGGAVYLDVRSIPEFEQGHPAGAFNVPLLHLDPATGQMRPNPDFVNVVRANFPQDMPMLIGCKMGGRSAQACEILSSAGYRDLANVLGGFSGAPQMGQAGWAQEGLPVETASRPAHDYAALQKKSAPDR